MTLCLNPCCGWKCVALDIAITETNVKVLRLFNKMSNHHDQQVQYKKNKQEMQVQHDKSINNSGFLQIARATISPRTVRIHL